MADRFGRTCVFALALVATVLQGTCSCVLQNKVTDLALRLYHNATATVTAGMEKCTIFSKVLFYLVGSLF